MATRNYQKRKTVKRRALCFSFFNSWELLLKLEDSYSSV